MMDAYELKIYRQRELNAEQAIWNLLPHIERKNIPSIEDLIGKPPGAEEERTVTTKDDLDELKALMGKGGN